MSKVVLNPCPRCGAQARIVEESDEQNYFYVECSQCGDMTWFYFSESSAIEAWNRMDGERNERD